MTYLSPRQWYQFADDAAVTSGLESENQSPPNSGTSSKQFHPKLFVNNEIIPPVKQDEYFTYLGRHFDYKMTNNQHKDDLLSDTKNIMKKIDDIFHFMRKIRC